MPLRFARENNLDVMRLGLAIGVILSHSFPMAGGPKAQEPLDGLTANNLNLGEVAVDGFFIISGYLIPMSLQRSAGAGEFLRRRVARIYPGFIVALLLSAFVFGPLGGAHVDSQTIYPVAAAIAFLHRWGAADAFVNNPLPEIINGSLWTIRYEFWCYILTLLAGQAGLLRRRWPIGAALLAAVLAAEVVQRHSFHTPTPIAFLFGTLDDWPRLLSFYLAGTCIYLYGDRMPTGVVPLVVAAAACASIAFSHTLGILLLPLALAYLVFRLAFSDRLRLPNLSRWLGGDYSYGTYLYAWPIQQLIVLHRPGIGAIALFCLATPLTLIAGALSWHLVEKRFLNRSRVRAVEAPPAEPAPAAAA